MYFIIVFSFISFSRDNSTFFELLQSQTAVTIIDPTLPPVPGVTRLLVLNTDVTDTPSIVAECIRALTNPVVTADIAVTDTPLFAFEINASSNNSVVANSDITDTPSIAAEFILASTNSVVKADSAFTDTPLLPFEINASSNNTVVANPDLAAEFVPALTICNTIVTDNASTDLATIQSVDSDSPVTAMIIEVLSAQPVLPLVIIEVVGAQQTVLPDVPAV